MVPELFAFSVHNFISSVGADAGFAAIVGLAILVLLYFAHARETANLREEAAMLTQRLQQAEARVAQLSRVEAPAPAPAAPASVTAGLQAASAAGVAAIPFAPAGVGAPALAAATRVIPVARPPQQPVTVPAGDQVARFPQPAVAAGAPRPATATASGAGVAGSPQGAAPSAAPGPRVAPAPSGGQAPSAAPPPSAAPAPQGAPAPSAAPGPSPAPGAPGGGTRNGTGAPVAAGDPVPAPATAAGANGAGNEPVATPVGAGQGLPPRTGQGSPPSRVQTRPAGTAAGRPPLPPLGEPAARRSSVGRRMAVLAGALGIVAVAAALVVATSGGTSSSSSTSAARTTNAPARSRPAPLFVPASATVAVLNGTATNQLAHRVGAKLSADGYKEGRLATASDQTRTTTVVAYLPGAKNRTDALHVATSLNLKPSSVQLIDQSTQQVACPPPGACTANVVVTVGADLATL